MVTQMLSQKDKQWEHLDLMLMFICRYGGSMSCKFEKFQLAFCFQNQMPGKKLSFAALGHLRERRSIRYV